MRPHRVWCLQAKDVILRRHVLRHCKQILRMAAYAMHQHQQPRFFTRLWRGTKKCIKRQLQHGISFVKRLHANDFILGKYRTHAFSSCVERSLFCISCTPRVQGNPESVQPSPSWQRQVPLASKHHRHRTAWPEHMQQVESATTSAHSLSSDCQMAKMPDLHPPHNFAAAICPAYHCARLRYSPKWLVTPTLQALRATKIKPAGLAACG